MPLTNEAIEALQKSSGIEAARISVLEALNCNRPNIALPDNFKLHDIENRLPKRIRPRGVFKTTQVESFASYVLKHGDENATVFVDGDELSAVGVLNLGSKDYPGHADNLARLQPVPTAGLLALEKHTETKLSQKTAAEFLEDWRDHINAFSGINELKLSQVIAAVRKITIESARRDESTVENLGAARSAFESVQASSIESLPELLYFRVTPYDGFDERTYVMRFGVLTGDKDPVILLRILRKETHKEQLASELTDKVKIAIADAVPVLLGVYNKSA